jgi:hypothetical protein
MKPEELAQLKLYRNLTDLLLKARMKNFPHGSRVLVDCARYKGPGTAVVNCDKDVPLDQLSVQLDNGNVWWYPIECCAAVK